MDFFCQLNKTKYNLFEFFIKNYEVRMITEDLINQVSPDAASTSNGRKLSSSGKFQNLMKNAEGTVFWGECAGSGKNPYRVSLQIEDGSSNVTSRCSCPSRKFPCKHGIGLMFEIIANKTFTVGEMSEELSAKVEKKAAAEAKKEAKKKAVKEGTVEVKKITATQKKKIQKQIETLDNAEKLLEDLLSSGVATLSGKSTSDFDEVVNSLANYAPGLKVSFERISEIIEEIRKTTESDKIDNLYKNALNKIVYINSVINKSKEYLNDVLADKKNDISTLTEDDHFLFEALGGTWTIDKLIENKLFEENAQLIQLSFKTEIDFVKKEYVDKGYYLNLNTKEIFQTLNMCPFDRRDKMKKEISNFNLVEVPTLYKYPNHNCKRVRWEKFTLSEIKDSDYKKAVLSCETDIASAIKKIKNIVKNTLAQKEYPMILPVSKILYDSEKSVLVDKNQGNIILATQNENGFEEAFKRVGNIPVKINEDDAIFGIVFYDEVKQTYLFNPLSYLDGKKVIRFI